MSGAANRGRGPLWGGLLAGSSTQALVDGCRQDCLPHDHRSGMVVESCRAMGKRIMLVVVGAGIGSLAGLLVSFLGVGNWALIVGAVAGGLIPPLVLGPPSQPTQ